jgi:hypothetical protein
MLVMMPLFTILLFLYRIACSECFISPIRNPFYQYARGRNDIWLHNELSATAFSLVPCASIEFPDVMAAATTSNTLALNNDSIQTLGVGILFLLIIGTVALAFFVQQSVVPEQMNKLAWMVKEELSEQWEAITSQLKKGERVRDRPDLIAALTQAGFELMKDESESEMKQLILMIQNQTPMDNNGGDDDDGLSIRGDDLLKSRKVIEATIGSSIEEFVAKADKNQDSTFLTRTRGELARLLKEKF